MNKFRVLLVYPNLQMVNLLPPNIATLSAYLKSGGIDVRVFDTTLYKTAEKSVDDIRVEHMQLRPFNLKEKGVDYKTADVFIDFKKIMEDFRPNVVGLSATDDTWSLGLSLISKIKKSNIHVIVGGVYPTFSPDNVINNEAVNSVCLGEGEEALLELCKKLEMDQDITSIKNLWVKKDGKVYKNSMRSLIDINNIPYEDFSIFEEKRFFRPMQGKVFRMIPISPDRGCPFTCTFCAAPLLRKLYVDPGTNSYFRIKDVNRVIDELKYHAETYKADYIYFNSETFFVRKYEGLKEFARRYTRDIGLPFWCQTRVDTITEKKVKMLKDMNCDRMSIGLEHGNEQFRRKFLKKNFTNIQVINAFRILEENQIPVTVNNIIGFPDETRELVFDTIELNRQITADSINAYFFVPYSGTPLREYCINKGYINSNVKTDSLHGSSALNMSQFPPEEIKGLVRTFPLYVKMPKSYYDKIQIAEQLNDAGDRLFAELRDVYFREYFK